MIYNQSSQESINRRKLLLMIGATGFLPQRSFAQTKDQSDEACLTASIVSRKNAHPTPALDIPAELETSFHNVRKLFGLSSDIKFTMPNDSKLTRTLGSPAIKSFCKDRNYAELVVPYTFYNNKVRGDLGKILYVLGHELSHVAQLETQSNFREKVCKNTKVSLKKYELLCDLGAGFAHLSLTENSNRSPIQLIASVADYQFANVRHHGVVTERASAFGLGRILAAQKKAYSMASWIRNIDVLNHRGLFTNGYTNEESYSPESIIERLYQ